MNKRDEEILKQIVAILEKELEDYNYKIAISKRGDKKSFTLETDPVKQPYRTI